MKISKNFLGMMMAVVMIFSLSVPTFAAEPAPAKDSLDPVASSELVITRDENGNVQFEVSSNGIEPRIPGWGNKINIYIYDVDQDRVKVSIQNMGLDWVDSVSMNVKIYNSRGLQYNQNWTETSIKQFVPRNKQFYIVGWNRIVLSNIVAMDEGDVGYLSNMEHWK